MKHLFIVNPVAGGSDRSAEIRNSVETLFSGKNTSYEVYVTKAPGDATSKIRQEAVSGEEIRIYSCGGDGTFNECATGCVGLSNVSVCPYPAGTGNDFCRMFGEEKHLFTNLDALVNGSIRPIDIIKCGDSYSINICSVGLDARIGTNVHKYTSVPFVSGMFAYIVSTVAEIIKGISQKIHVYGDSFDIDEEHTLICACNGRFYGGGFNPTTEAKPDDGIMDVFIVKKVNLFQLVGLIGKYASGKAGLLPHIIKHVRTDCINIEFENEDVFNVDGEAVIAKKAELRLIPKAVNLIVPMGMKFFEQ